jgi:glucokinase
VTAAGEPGASDAPMIGVDVGGTNVRVALVDRGGRVLADERESTPEKFPELVDIITDQARTLLGGQEDGVAIGIGAAGLVDREGTIHYAPNIPMFRRVPLGTEVGKATGLPVTVDNDANVAALGELRHGAARGKTDALVITLGTGVGGGIILGGRVIHGAHGFAAEVGHWQFDPDGERCACGEPGHWEAEASGNALGRLGRERAAAGEAPELLASVHGDLAAITGERVGDAAQAGDPDAVEVLERYARNVAIGFVGLANLVDPEVIVVSGGLVELGDLLLDPIRRSFDRHLEGAEFRPSVPVIAAELGSRAGVIGAAVLARERAL